MNLSPTAKTMLLRIGVLFLVALAVGLVLYRFGAGSVAYALGLLLGTLVSVLKLMFLDKSIAKSVDMDVQSARNNAMLSYVFRYVLSAVVLIASAIMPQISLLGSAIGILLLQFAAYSVQFFPLGKNLNK